MFLFCFRFARMLRLLFACILLLFLLRDADSFAEASHCDLRRAFFTQTFPQRSCRPSRIIIRSLGCYGECFSSATSFSYKTGFASTCSCCQPIQYKVRKVATRCNGKRKIIQFPSASKCACRPCL